MSAYDNIDDSFRAVTDTHDPGEWVVAIAGPDIDGRPISQAVPEAGFEDATIAHKQVLIQSRSAHTMHRQRGRADQGVRDVTVGQERSNTIEQRHKTSQSFERDVSRPVARARLNARRALASSTSWALWYRATSSSPSRKASSMRRGMDSFATASEVSSRRPSATDLTPQVYERSRVEQRGDPPPLALPERAFAQRVRELLEVRDAVDEDGLLIGIR